MSKLALITGSSRGVGKEIAIELAKNNFNLILISRNLSDLKKLKKYIDNKFAPKKIKIIKGDVSKRNEAISIYKKCKKKFGLPDIVINNTGGPPSGKFDNFSIKDWDIAINNNLISVISFTKQFHAEMIKRKWGRLITISSTVAKEPSPNMVISATLRSGVSAFNKAISFDLAKYNITVNTVLLGGVKTDRLYELAKKNAKIKKINLNKYLNKIQTTIPIGRFASPTEIANLVSFLASEKSSYITGQNIVIDGGLSKSN